MPGRGLLQSQPSSQVLHEITMANEPVYKVIFHNGNQVFEVFARQIYQSDMWGFIEVEEPSLGSAPRYWWIRARKNSKMNSAG